MAAISRIRNNMSTYRVHAYNPTTTKISITQINANSVEEASTLVMNTHLPIYRLLKVEVLNEYKNWEPSLQVAITPVDGRMETGPLKINEDWCGYFMRGDNAVGLAIDAQEVEDWFNRLPDVYRKEVWIQMPNLIAAIKEMSACRNK